MGSFSRPHVHPGMRLAAACSSLRNPAAMCQAAVLAWNLMFL